ncbi:MAG: RNA polymerase sigma factor SigA [Fimbriimonadaceae bacterium]|nr:RNA polymerase sigma factor SigA [Fimbriimonadaceae bacterium]
MNSSLMSSNSRGRRATASWLLSFNTTTLAQHEVLSENRERQLAENAKLGCEKSRQLLIQSNFRLVFCIARRYASPSMPLEDLLQEGQVGLIRAAERFDASHGCRFATYASWWIRQAIIRSIQDHARTIRVPAHLQDGRDKVHRSQRDLESLLGRKPTAPEVADHAGVEVETVRFWLEHSLETVTIETEVLEKAIAGDSLAEADPELAYLVREANSRLSSLMECLNDREREVIRLRYGLKDQTPQSLAEVAGKVKVTRERVRQIEMNALRKLRSIAQAVEFAPHLA